MALESNVPAGRIFVGQRTIHVYELFAANQDPKHPHATMQDAAAMAFLWALHRAIARIDSHRVRADGPALITRTTIGGAITVSGTFNAVRSLNSQRIYVDVTYPADLLGGRYVDILRRTDDGSNLAVSYGTEPILVGAA